MMETQEQRYVAMSIDPKVTRVEVEVFTWDVKGMGRSPSGHRVYDPADTRTRSGTAVKVYTDAGVVGEYVQGYGLPTRPNPEEIASIGRWLIGRSALEREPVYERFRNLRHSYGTVDIVLWDVAAKLMEVPIYRLLGGYRRRLPAYASTVFGANSGPLSTPESYADFAEQCYELGYRAYKIHPYPWEDIQTHIDTVLAVGKRVGGKMDLMLDSICLYRTFADAVKVGKACDEAGFYWYEDPYSDGGVTPFSHEKLRELIRTPLLQGEKTHSLQERMALVLAKATDFVRGEVAGEGITGTLKMAHAAESVGLDIELHGAGPAQRHTMAALRNSNYYEVSVVHPDLRDLEPPVYKEGYESGLDGCKDGYVMVPEGPGLGVVYDWDYIGSHSQGKIVVSA